jgi:antitoxin MazE
VLSGFWGAMSIVTLTKWGNSIGIRILSMIMKEAHLYPGEALDIKAGDDT